MKQATIRSVTMKDVTGLILLLLNVRLSHSCSGEGHILICLNIPPAFSPGYSSLLMLLNNVGEINSTVFHSDNLSSVTRLRMENAGVTRIAQGAFSSFQSLTSLSLNQNLLTEVNPNWFGRPDILSELNLTENQIEVLSESILNGLMNLTRLSLRKNRIRTIDPHSFSSLTMLAELDLSQNRMTWVSPQVFRSLRSTRIRLDGNPWDCSCGTEDFVVFLKDLHSRSLLDSEMEVTCESPPSLRGRPVWNVSVCVTPLPPKPPSATQTAHPKPTDILTAAPASTSAKVVTSPPSWPTSETKTSVQPKPTDSPATSSSHTAKVVTSPPSWQTSETKTSVQPKPTDLLTAVTSPAVTTGTFAYVTSARSPSSETELSDLPRTVSAPTETCVTSRPSSNTDIVCTLVVVIVVLSLLLFVACFLALLHRRKRNNKTVMPGHPEENRQEVEENSRSSRSPSPGQKRETWDSVVGWRRSFAGVRAKSANAILFTSPFCKPVKDQVTLQTQSKDAGKQIPGSETEVDGRVETENLTATDAMKNVTDAGRNSDENHHVSVNTDTVPYLSIGTNQHKPIPDDFKQSTDGPGQRSQTGKVMGRISTWPPTAVQWQARCKMEEEVGSDIFTVWTLKFPDEVEKVLNKVELPSGSAWAKKEDEMEKNQMEDPLKMTVAHITVGQSQSSKPNDETISLSEAFPHTDTRLEEQLKKEEMHRDPASVRHTQNLNQEKICPNQAENPAHKSTRKSSDKAEQRTEPKRAAASRQRPENRSIGPKAPSGGASPDDETLLSGNEYAFMDLLHEVVQNNGRWTRERWKQIHHSKQLRHNRGTEGV